MIKATRRRFLKQVGAMGTGLMLRPPAPSLAAPLLAETAGRAFALTPIRRQSHADASIIAQLPPHATTPIEIITADGRWYQIPSGFVERVALQPIAPYQRPVIESELGFYAEMIAPVSTIRAWCAARAPISATLGYGAILYVMDRLMDDRGMVWYGLATQAQQALLGWSPALHYARWQHMTIDQRLTHLQLDTQASYLDAYQGQRLIVRLPATANGKLPKTCQVKALGLLAQGDDMPLGAPYQIQVDSDGIILGSYWHNRFVREPKEIASNIQFADKVTIELPIYAARWLYSALGSDEMVMTIE
jgi:hypothetical protein